jgi:DNA polymerase IV
VRLVGISSTNLLKNYNQWPLFVSEQKQRKVLEALDKVNDRFGEFTVKRAFLNKTESLGRKSVGFGGAKRF